MNISDVTLEMIKGALAKANTTTGISESTGLNFYYLEEQAKNIYPVFYPILASTPRVNPMFNGSRVGGTAVNWKAITAINPGYIGVSEGNRNAVMSLTEQDFAATFKFLGVEGQVSFQAQDSGLGFDDNIALQQLAMLNGLLNAEEQMILYGNSGSAGNGFQLGTAPTPTIALASGGTIATSTNLSVRVVALTAWGVSQATSTGVLLAATRTNTDGSTDTVNGGTSAISAASNVVTTSSGMQSATATWSAVNGAVGYAVYVDSTDASSPTTANAVFAAVVSAPTYTFGTLPSGSNQKGNATGLNADKSANALDFDGILTWGFNAASASSPSYVKDLGGATLTSNGDGTIAEFETALDYLWQNYKIVPDKIYLGGTLISSVAKKILNGGSTGAQRLVFENSDNGQLVGGSKVVQYRCKYSTTGLMKVLDVATHPWLPAGVILFDLTTNPYPAAGNSIPAVRRIVSLEDHFSIKWPYRKLQHELGVYCFETLQHYIPFGIAILTGVANG